jgi:hypothetical protein
MFRNNPPALITAFAFLIGIFVVFPWVSSKGVRVTPVKVVALVIALGIGVYSRFWMMAIGFIMPLSLIWFPEHWGNYTGYFQGGYIDQKTPPVIVSFMGWIFLIGFPLMMSWIIS